MLRVDIARVAAVMRQGDKSVKMLDRRTGAVLSLVDVSRLNINPECLAPIPQIDARTMYGWIQEWLKSMPDCDFRVKLSSEVSGQGAFGRLKQALRDHQWSESWDKFRSKKLCMEAHAWLESIGVSYSEVGTHGVMV